MYGVIDAYRFQINIESEMFARFYMMFALFNPCFSETEHFLESLEDLHHLGLTVTDLLEIEQLANSINDQELETLGQVLQNLTEDQVAELSDKSVEELDLLFRMQGNRSKKTKRSPFGLSLTANIRTQHFATQGWIPLPPPPPPYALPFASEYLHQNQYFAGSSYYGGVGSAFHQGRRYGRSTEEDEN